MTDRKAQYRQSKAKERQAKREAGLVPVEVWVPKDGVGKIKTLAAGLRAGAAKSPKVTTTP